MNDYQIKKEKARQRAIEWQTNKAREGCDYLTLFRQQEIFIKLAKRYGLTKEFKENGII